MVTAFTLRQVVRIVALAALLSMTWFNRVELVAEGCDQSQFLAACNQAVNSFNTFCNDWCYDEYGVAGYEDGSQCHWVGENESPADCEEFYPESCGCFDTMNGGHCECVMW